MGVAGKNGGTGRLVKSLPSQVQCYLSQARHPKMITPRDAGRGGGVVERGSQPLQVSPEARSGLAAVSRRKRNWKGMAGPGGRVAGVQPECPPCRIAGVGWVLEKPPLSSVVKTKHPVCNPLEAPIAKDCCMNSRGRSCAAGSDCARESWPRAPLHTCTHAHTRMQMHSYQPPPPTKDPHLDPVLRKAEEQKTPWSPPLPDPPQGLGGVGATAVSEARGAGCDMGTALEDPASSDGALDRA